MINKSVTWNKEEVVKRLNNNENIEDIAAELKCDSTELIEEIRKEYYYSESRGKIQRMLYLEEIIKMLNNNTSMEEVAILIEYNPMELKGEIQKTYYYSESKRHWFSLHEIVTERLNKREKFKDVAKDIGFEESTFRKRLEKEYYWDATDKSYYHVSHKEFIEEYGLEECIEELRSINNCIDSMEETEILIMERYKNKNYWEDRGYRCLGEKCIKEEILLIEHLNKELEEDSKKLGISKREVIQLYLLRYLSQNRKRKGSGLKFDGDYKKSMWELRDELLEMGFEQFTKRQWPKLLDDEIQES